MRRRITFVHGAEDGFDPSQTRLNNDSLDISSIKGAREDRITLGSQQLPQEVEALDFGGCSTIADLGTVAMEGIEAMSRAPHPVGFTEVLSNDYAICVPNFSRTACVFHSLQDPVCVCKAIPSTLVRGIYAKYS